MKDAFGSQRKHGLEPECRVFGAVAYLGFHLVFGGHEPALPTVVLDRRADRERTAAIAGDGLSGLRIVRHLPVEIAARTDRQPVAEAPARRIVDDEFLTGPIIRRRVAPVEGPHDLGVEHGPVRPPYERPGIGWIAQ